MKAYHVSDLGGYGHIVFAETRGKAKVKAIGDEFHTAEFIELSVTRAPYADEFANLGYVPKEALLANGWWLECRCGKQQTVDDSPLIIEEIVYCEKCNPNKED